jgi:hypothetical protein
LTMPVPAVAVTAWWQSLDDMTMQFVASSVRALATVLVESST